MSLDLFQRETAERLGTMPAVQDPDMGTFGRFWRGAGLTTMQNLARVGRSIDMAGAFIPIAQDAFTGGTAAQEKYFKEHDEVFGSAMDYWTPKPNEVGMAGQITGEVLSMLPLVIASPGLAVGATQLGTAEDLVQKGVSAGKAQAVGAVQGAGLGLGVWMPILGQNLWQRVVVGGAGANVLQGVGTRAASGMILEGTKAADEFKAFDGHALTLDVLMGAAFGGIVHLSPKGREQGAAAWERITDWAQDLTPSQKAALVTLRLAQHLNVDSTPGKPATAMDVEAHVNRVRTALEQLERGQPVEVSNMTDPHFEAEPNRVAEMEKNGERLASEAERVRKAEGIPEIAEQPAQRADAVYSPEEKHNGKVDEIKYLPVSVIERQEMDFRPEVMTVSDEVAKGMDYSQPIDVTAFRFGKSNDDLHPAVTLTDGHHRVAAALQTGKEYLPVNVKAINAKGAKLNALIEMSKKIEAEIAAKKEQKTEAPAGQPRGAEPPPPRGPSEGKPAGAEANAKTLDPIAREAERMATEQPDRPIRVGTDPEGRPITMTAKQFLEDARLAADDARKDMHLFEAAAQCLLGRA